MFGFGRKKTTESSGQTAQSAHDSLLSNIRAMEKDQPLLRPQLGGRILYDLVCQMVERDGRIRMDDVLAILASCGGFACIRAALAVCAARGQSPREAGIVVADGGDGQRYLFGDLPNSFLIEDQYSLLSLALGAAHARGAAVSVETATQAMAHVAQSVGGPQFGVPRLPDAHRPSDLPINLVNHLWPKFAEALALYEVTSEKAPASFGFALSRVIGDPNSPVEPLLAAQIAVECAAPMAKLDPARFN